MRAHNFTFRVPNLTLKTDRLRYIYRIFNLSFFLILTEKLKDFLNSPWDKWKPTQIFIPEFRSHSRKISRFRDPEWSPTREYIIILLFFVLWKTKIKKNKSIFTENFLENKYLDINWITLRDIFFCHSHTLMT
jgi:hypothetical protein